MTADDIGRGFLDSLATLAPIDLTPEEALRIWKDRETGGVFTLVAEIDGAIVGTASLIIELKFIHRGGKVGHVEDVGVHSEHAGKGIGTELVRRLTEIAAERGCYKVILNCQDRLLPFYGRIGYRRHDNGMRHDCL
jgi:glucosamine-phosphate N-acetyltransferase